MQTAIDFLAQVKSRLRARGEHHAPIDEAVRIACNLPADQSITEAVAAFERWYFCEKPEPQDQEILLLLGSKMSSN
jgi:hypothetical protein